MRIVRFLGGEGRRIVTDRVGLRHCGSTIGRVDRG